LHQRDQSCCMVQVRNDWGLGRVKTFIRKAFRARRSRVQNVL